MSAVVKCIYIKPYCERLKNQCTHNGILELKCDTYFQDDDVEDGEVCCRWKNYKHITIYKKVQSVEIAPEYVLLGKTYINEDDIVELWIDYGDGKGFIPEIVHS